MVILSAIAIPTAILWGRGTAHLRPELHWAAIKWWHWLVLGALGFALVALVVGIPSP